MTEQQPEPRTKVRTILVFSMLFAIFGAVIVLAYFATFARPVTTVILVRHAEKNIEPENPNPNLSPAGQKRAQELVRLLGRSGITAIYATQYVRTQQTVQPLAAALGVPITQVDAKNTDELVRQITSTHRGGIVFLAGHNNSVPAIIGALGGGDYPVIPETEYDNMFVVTMYRYGKAKTIQLKYGSSAPAEGTSK